MTYNIRLARQMGRRRIVEIVRAAAPDVLALQEVGSSWREGPPGDTAAAIALRTGLDHWYFLPTITEGLESRYGHALLSRWPISATSTRPLPRRIDEPRSLLEARIVTPDIDLDVMVVHLSHRSPDRAIQGPELVDRAKMFARDETDVQVVMGDLNETEETGWLHDLRTHFQSATQLDARPTHENPNPEARIDDMLVRGGDWRRAEVLAHPDASDHRPIVGDVESD